MLSPPSEHTDFSESTEEIAPLTEEEKQAKLQELREKSAAKRALKAVEDQEDAKRNEVCTHARTYTKNTMCACY